MFKPGDVVKILIPNVVNTGYDYRLTLAADLGTFVRVSVMNRPYVGIVYGVGDSNLPPDKIKNQAGCQNSPGSQTDCVRVISAVHLISEAESARSAEPASLPD